MSTTSTCERILDFSQHPAYLRADGALLSIESADNPIATLPFAEIAAVLLSHPQTTITRGALAGLAQAGAIVVTADESYLPISMMLPLTGFHAPARRMAAQLAAQLPTRKRLWQQVIHAKISAQASLLEEERGEDFGLRSLAAEVRSGDPDNCEGQAARIYWPSLFNDLNFTRRSDVPNQNRYLNYAYAIVRAVTTRAICAVGLHPGLGLHHHHRENPFCLADDLMEPFRPAADRIALNVLRDFGPDAEMEKKLKARLIDVTNQRFDIAGEQRTLFDALAKLALSVASVFEGRGDRATLPDFQSETRP